MANVGKIGTTLKENLLYKPVNWLGKTNLVKNRLGKQYQLNNDKLITGVGVFSVVAKDGVNCAYYVTQSLNNDRIPEDKRKFVAGLDLANGILNVTLQAGVAKIMDSYVGEFFDKKIAPKHFSKEKYKEMWNGMENKVKFEDFARQMERNKGFAKSGLRVITALVAMQVLTKRIIVPLIATPLASVFKKQFEKGEKNKADKENKTIANA